MREVGHNRGPEIDAWLAALGLALGSPYCAAFCMAGIRYVDTKRGALSWLHRSGHVLTVWNESPREARLVRPEPGVLAVYQHWRDGKATTEGHMGIVARTLDRVTFRDIEANTSAGTGEVVREGEGVLARVRTTDGTRAMHLKGFLCPWADIPSTTRVV